MNRYRKDIGDLGESLAIDFLEKRGHEIIAKKYRTIYGELDVVSCENSIVHFVEVKTIDMSQFSRETYIMPEEHVTRDPPIPYNHYTVLRTLKNKKKFITAASHIAYVYLV